MFSPWLTNNFYGGFRKNNGPPTGCVVSLEPRDSKKVGMESSWKKRRKTAEKSSVCVFEASVCSVFFFVKVEKKTDKLNELTKCPACLFCCFFFVKNCGCFLLKSTMYGIFAIEQGI